MNEITNKLDFETFVTKNHTQSGQLLTNGNNIINSIKSIEFSTANIEQYKEDIKTARALKTQIEEFRKGYKNDYLAVIQSDLDQLLNLEKAMKAEINNTDQAYKDWEDSKKQLRLMNLTTAFASLIVDYPLLSKYEVLIDYVLPTDWWQAKYKKLEPIIEKITTNMNEKENLLKVVEHPAVLVKCNFDMSEYAKVLEFTKDSGVIEKKVEPVVKSDTNTVTIELHKNYLETLDEMNIKYVIK